MTRIATYVFIDLETTSLPCLEYNKTRITELSMVVVKRSHILDTRPGAVPRVQHKFTMCFNPRRMIDPGSTDTSGLCNDLLEHESDFNMNVFNAIHSFLQCLEKPVCLVAQNGQTFDFPILKNHFEKLNVALSDDILCADSLYAFCDIFENRCAVEIINAGTSTVDSAIKTQNTPVVSNSSNNKVITVTNKGSDKPVMDKQITDKKEEVTKVKLDIIQACENKKQMSDDQTDEGRVSSVEPSQCFDENALLNSQKISQQLNESTPKQNKLQDRIPPKKLCQVRRKLFWGTNQKPQVSYKLKDIYERVFRRPAIEAHRAENDCMMAMEISVSIAKQFVVWVDENHIAFTEVKPMRPGVPLGH